MPRSRETVFSPFQKLTDFSFHSAPLLVSIGKHGLVHLINRLFLEPA